MVLPYLRRWRRGRPAGGMASTAFHSFPRPYRRAPSPARGRRRRRHLQHLQSPSRGVQSSPLPLLEAGLLLEQLGAGADLEFFVSAHRERSWVSAHPAHQNPAQRWRFVASALAHRSRARPRPQARRRAESSPQLATPPRPRPIRRNPTVTRTREETPGTPPDNKGDQGNTRTREETPPEATEGY